MDSHSGGIVSTNLLATYDLLCEIVDTGGECYCDGTNDPCIYCLVGMMIKSIEKWMYDSEVCNISMDDI